MTLKKLSGEIIHNPSEKDVITVFSDVLAHPYDEENGATAIQLKRNDGWILTAYGYELVILEHKDDWDNIPVHISNFNEENVLKLLVRFLSIKDNLSNLKWQIGYGN